MPQWARLHPAMRGRLQSPADERERPTILVVEDEQIVALDLEQTLHEIGYHVVGVTDNGSDAIALADEHKPKLVLMDVLLRGKMSGIDAASRISRSGETPVIFLTANSDRDTVSRAAEVAPYGFIIKPFNLKELTAAIEI
ncbi:MAG TPA: response regulator, partial [Candidatus Baltobacteraceae bacterium]